MRDRWKFVTRLSQSRNNAASQVVGTDRANRSNPQREVDLITREIRQQFIIRTDDTPIQTLRKILRVLFSHSYDVTACTQQSMQDNTAMTTSADDCKWFQNFSPSLTLPCVRRTLSGSSFTVCDSRNESVYKAWFDQIGDR